MNELNCRCSPARSEYAFSASWCPASSKSRTRKLTGLPEPSTTPKFVRNFADSETCWKLSVGVPEGGGVWPGIGMPELALVANDENGSAAMNWPSVPRLVVTNVRLEA